MRLGPHPVPIPVEGHHDVERNLRGPLAGVQALARAMRGEDLLRVHVPMGCLDVLAGRFVAPGAETAKVPFRSGEAYGRDLRLGQAVGGLARGIETRLEAPALVTWVEQACLLDPAAAENVVRHLADQRERGAVPTDRRLVLEAFPDEPGRKLRRACTAPARVCR